MAVAALARNSSGLLKAVAVTAGMRAGTGALVLVSD